VGCSRGFGRRSGRNVNRESREGFEQLPGIRQRHFQVCFAVMI
jgi:hypothetical protein